MRRTAGRRVLAPMLAGVLGLALVAGCGGSEKDYCEALGKQQELFVDDGSGVALIKNLDILRDLAEDAPDDLSDEWQTVIRALSGLADAIADAGVQPEDFADGKPPASVGADARELIVRAASRITEADVIEAFNGIDQQAKDVCKLQLGL